MIPAWSFMPPNGDSLSVVVFMAIPFPADLV
jgi:hypothetical protein